MLDFIRTFINLNQDIIHFGYGLAFFVLGVAIALQSRHYSRLDLARTLKWLAAFGFAHGFHEWGDLFIPIQMGYLNPVTIEFLHIIHLGLLALSYVFLFEFGVALLKPLGRARWLHGVSAALLAIWVFVSFFPLPTILLETEEWHNTANALARYFIGFPAGLLAAYGLRQHTMHRIVPLQVPHIEKMLRFTGILLGFYAFFGGLIAPPVSFFPGNCLNNYTFQAFFGFPPSVVRSLIGLGLVISMIRSLEVFDVETARIIESMEQQQILSAERNRLGRDLHDGAIQKVYTAGLLVESASKLVDSNHPIVSTRLEKAVNVINDAISDLRHNLVELQTIPNDEPFPNALIQLAEDPRFRSLVDVQLSLDLPAAEHLSPARAEHVLAIIHEALSNAIRHARANTVKINACSTGEQLSITIIDDGSGLPYNHSAGYGLRNMRDRARLLGGSLVIDGKNGKGTQITLAVPWKDER